MMARRSGRRKGAADRTAELAARARAAGAVRRHLDAATLQPMLAETARGAFSKAGWLFEAKYDGVRVLAARSHGGRVRLFYRSRRDATPAFTEIARAVAGIACAEFILDGEITALDESGAMSFERLQRRLHPPHGTASSRAAGEIPVVMFCFELLSAGGYDLRGLPLAVRKQLLHALVPPSDWLRVVEYVEREGERLFSAVAERGLEGMVAKRAASTYECGRRSRDWLKVKTQHTADVVIVGFVRGKGCRRHLGSLMAAWRHDGELLYAGNVGSGLNDSLISQLLPRLEKAATPVPAFRGQPPGPPRANVFVVPELVAEVRYSALTAAGHLRHPVFLRLRDDKAISECLAPQSSGPLGCNAAPG